MLNYCVLLLTCVALNVSVVQYADAQNSDTLLYGEYIVTEFFTEDVDGSKSGYNLLTFDGEGAGSFDVIYSSIEDYQSGVFTYDVNEDGTFVLTVDDSVQRGIVNPNGESFTMVETEITGYGLFIGIKKSSGMNNAVLDGEFILNGYFIEEGAPIAALNSIRFDGEGNGTIEGIGRSKSEIGIIPLTYSVNNDGTLFITITQNNVVLPGVVCADGESISLITTAADSDEYGIYYGIKKSQDIINAEFEGEYIITGYVNESITSAEYTLAIVDGQGNGTLNTIFTSSGDTYSSPFFYNKQDNGLLIATVSDEGGDVFLQGIIHSDKSSLLLVNTNNIGFGVYVGIVKSNVSTGIQSIYDALTNIYSLNQNYPNPFNPTTTISYALPSRSQVPLTVYNATGQQVRSYDFGIQDTGNHEYVFDGSGLPSGVYLYRVEAGGNEAYGRMLLMK